jgi:hypothetical protein
VCRPAVSEQWDRGRVKFPVPIVIWTRGLFAYILMSSICNRAPHLIEYDEQSNKQAHWAPLVVVGVVDSDQPVGQTLPSHDDLRYPMQLHQARVHLENVLRGSIDRRSVFVYYFRFASAFDGPWPLGFGRVPSRRVLWLRRDAVVLRMACDGWDGCTMFVESGAHPYYRADLSRSLDYALADLLLTRGERKIDGRRFASEIEWYATRDCRVCHRKARTSCTHRACRHQSCRMCPTVDLHPRSLRKTLSPPSQELA